MFKWLGRLLFSVLDFLPKNSEKLAEELKKEQLLLMKKKLAHEKRMQEIREIQEQHDALMEMNDDGDDDETEENPINAAIAALIPNFLQGLQPQNLTSTNFQNPQLPAPQAITPQESEIARHTKEIVASLGDFQRKILFSSDQESQIKLIKGKFPQISDNQITEVLNTLATLR